LALEHVLIVENLEKKIKDKQIIHNLSFEVNKGEIFGFLGPNGAGKTTTIRMLTGMIKPTSGSVTIMGYNIENQFTEAMKHISAIVGHPSLFEYMTGWQNLIQSARVSGKPINKEHIKWCIKTVELSDRINEKVENYSLGMKQRLAIAQSLISSPDILILDEPTNGMDPSGIKDMRALIRKLSKEHQITVFLCSHLLSEIQNVCDQVLIMNKGKYITSGPVKDLVQSNNSEFILSIDSLNTKIAYELFREQNIHVEINSNKLIVNCNKDQLPHLVNMLYCKKIYVYGINQKESSLEDYFLSVTREVI